LIDKKKIKNAQIDLNTTETNFNFANYINENDDLLAGDMAEEMFE